MCYAKISRRRCREINLNFTETMFGIGAGTIFPIFLPTLVVDEKSRILDFVTPLCGDKIGTSLPRSVPPWRDYYWGFSLAAYSLYFKTKDSVVPCEYTIHFELVENMQRAYHHQLLC